MANRNTQGFPSPEEDPRFHDTYQFLRRYRDATYSLKVVVHQMEHQFKLQYDNDIDKFLDSIYAAGADLTGSDIEQRAKSIARSNQMLKLLESSIDLLRNNHKHGEQYYWILYYAYDKEHDLLCDSQQSAENPDYAIITCFWVLLDFKKGVVYHTSGEFPIKLNFFSQDEQYEIIYIGEEQEALINHVMESIPSHGSKRLIVLESESQAAKITIDDVAAYCLVNESGTVSYYMRK